MVGGYVQKVVVWLLMEEGQLTADALYALADVQFASMRRALSDLTKLGLVQHELKQEVNSRPLYHYGLTAKGIDVALELELEQVKFYLKEKVNE